MICMRPIAPFGETAYARAPLSIQITARIQFEGIENLCEASAMNAAKGKGADELVGGVLIAGSALAEPMA
jgi:hypothetical protein